jgi:WS/DGAT/MGAT family acyltransferase
LTATDASFLRVETAHEPQHVGSLSILHGPPLRDAAGRVRLDDLRDHVSGRLHRVPRLRQRIMEVSWSQGRPVWIDDPAFDIDYHVRLTALPRPGDEQQLAVLMARLQSLALDRDRPLWEMWFVDGLADGDVGLIIKTHHALGDGIANVDLALALIDLEPDPPPADDPPEWRPRPAPSPQRLLADSVADQVTRPARLARSAVSAIRDPRPAIDTATNAVRTVVSFLSKPEPAPWNQPVSPHRRWVHADVPIDVAHVVKERHSVSLNDVVLAACTGALRDFLAERGEDTDGRTLKAMVPVSLRTDDEHGDTLGNRISLIVVDLPVHEPDPLSRLTRIHDVTSRLKGSGFVDGAQTIVQLADGIPPLATQLTRLVSRQIPMNLVITNIPGPPIPLFLLGARVLRTYPYVEVIDNEGLTIAVVSYEGHLFFGITSDRDVVPDLDRVAAGIEHHFGVLAAG